MLDFEKIFADNERLIFGYLLKICGNHSLAEELTQETFFRAYINLSSLRNEEKASVWLCSIAKNTYYAWYNENKKLLSSEQINATSDSSDLADLFIEKELSETAFRCLHSLDEPYKEVFMLKVFGCLSLKEISALFGKSESWARVTFYRAKQKITEGMDIE